MPAKAPFRGFLQQIKMNKLTPEEKRVIIDKGTEAPFTGEYVNNKASGIYICRKYGSSVQKDWSLEGLPFWRTCLYNLKFGRKVFTCMAGFWWYFKTLIFLNQLK